MNYFRFIAQGDIENKKLLNLPIRRGCEARCWCIGHCKRIVGWIDRAEYENFMSINNGVDQRQELLNSKCK